MEGRAQRDLGLAKADVAANEAVHWPSGTEVLDGCVDRRKLIISFLIGKTGTEFAIRAGPPRQAGRLAQLAFGGDLDQLAGDLADAALHARLARLPVAAAEPVEVDGRLF